MVTRGKFASANQKHYPDLASDASSVWNFQARFFRRLCTLAPDSLKSVINAFSRRPSLDAPD